MTLARQRDERWEVFFDFTSFRTLACGLNEIGVIKWITAELGGQPTAADEFSPLAKVLENFAQLPANI